LTHFSRQLVISARIGCIFDSPSDPSGTLRGGKLRVPTVSVNSGVPRRLRPAGLFCGDYWLMRGQPSRRNRPEQLFFLFFLGHARFLFLVKKIFLADEK